MTENQTNEIIRLLNTAIQKVDGLDDKVNGLQNEFNEFRDETRQNFDYLKNEMRFTARKTDVLADDVLGVRSKVKDVEKRVEQLEQKDAA